MWSTSGRELSGSAGARSLASAQHCLDKRKIKNIKKKRKIQKKYSPFIPSISTERLCMPLRLCQEVDPSILFLFLLDCNPSQICFSARWAEPNCCSCQADRCSSRLSRRLDRGPHNYQRPSSCQSCC